MNCCSLSASQIEAIRACCTFLAPTETAIACLLQEDGHEEAAVRHAPGPPAEPSPVTPLACPHLYAAHPSLTYK